MPFLGFGFCCFPFHYFKDESDFKSKGSSQQVLYRVDPKMKETDRHLKKLDELFNGQWGKLMESLVKVGLIKLLNQRNIEVQRFVVETEAPFEGKE